MLSWRYCRTTSDLSLGICFGIVKDEGGMTLGTVPSLIKLGVSQRFYTSKDDNYDSNSEAQTT